MQACTLVKAVSISIITSMLIGCGGGGGGGTVPQASPTLVSKTVSGSNFVYTYSDGSTVTKTISSSSTSWATDHVTRTVTYTLSDGNTDTITDTVAATISRTYNGLVQSKTYTYGDSYQTTETLNPTSTSSTWQLDNSVILASTYSDSSTNTYTSDFTWSNYDTYNNTASIETQFKGGVTIKQGGPGFVMGAGASAVTNAILHDAALNNQSYSKINLPPTIGWIVGTNSTSSVVDSVYERIVNTNSTSAYYDSEIMVINPYAAGFEYVTAMAWMYPYLSGGTEYQEYGAASGSYGGTLSYADLPTSGTVSYNGYSLISYISTWSDRANPIIWADFSASVDFAANTLTVAATNSTTSAGADSNYDYTGSATISTTTGQFSGSLSTTGAGLNYPLYGQFFGTNAAEMAGQFGSASGGLRGAFAAKR